MSNEHIRELLAKLREEIRKTGLDDETRNMVRSLDADIHDLIDPDHQQSDAGQIVERAKALEANFASGYPGAERFLREVIDALVRMGI